MIVTIHEASKAHNKQLQTHTIPVKVSKAHNKQLQTHTVPVKVSETHNKQHQTHTVCLLYTSPSPRDGLLSRMPSSA